MPSDDSDDEFEDAVDSLKAPQPRNRNGVSSAKSSTDVQARRSRLAVVRSRMRTEFGLGSSNFGGSQTSFDDISQSDCTSMASWGRKLLLEVNSETSPITVCPNDSASIKASTTQWVNSVIEEEEKPRISSPTQPLVRQGSHPPPIPPRKAAASVCESSPSSSIIPSPIPEVKNETEVRKKGHTKTNSLDRGMTLAKTIKCGPFPPPAGSKSISLGRGMSPVVVDGDSCEEEQRINTAQGVIHQLTMSVLSNDDECSVTEKIPTRTPRNNASSSRQMKRELPVVGEESSTASSTPRRVNPSPKLADSTQPGSDKSRKTHRRQVSYVEQQRILGIENVPFKECRSASELSRYHDGLDEVENSAFRKPLTHTHSIDPITLDVERRVSMKEPHSTMSSSHSGDGSREQSLHSMHSNFGHAKALVRTYSSRAQNFLRGAYQKAVSAMSSRNAPHCGSFVGKDDDEVLESDAASSSVSISASENNLRTKGRGNDPNAVICRPRSAKKGPHYFAKLRIVQELSDEHAGAIWCVRFSVCGKLLATAGHDNIVRVWAIKSHLQHFMRMREKYNQRMNDEASMHNEFERIHTRMEKEYGHYDDGHDDESSICSHKSPMDSSSTKSCSTQAQSISVSQNANTSTPDGVVFAPKPFCVFRGHTADVLDLSWSKNLFLLSSGMDHTVKLWHLTRSECLCCFQHADFVTCISFVSRDDRFFVSGSMDGKIRMWNIPEKKVACWNEVDQVGFITAITIFRNKFVIVGTYDGRCFFYNKDLKYHTVLNVRSSKGKNSRGHKISSLAVHGDKLLVTSNDSCIRMYCLSDMEFICKFKGAQIERSQIRASFSPDGKHVICGSEDHYAYIWHVLELPATLSNKKTAYERIRAHSSVVTAAIFAPKPQLFFDVLSKMQAYSFNISKRTDENYSPIPPPSQSTSPIPGTSESHSDSHNKTSPNPASSLLSAASRFVDEIRASKKNILRLGRVPVAGQSTGDVIVTADHNGIIKVMVNPAN